MKRARRQVSIIAGHDARALLSDPSPAVVLIVIPVILMGFTKEAFQAVLVASGYDGANGAEQSVPGLAVMFSFFLVSYVGYSIFDEHHWNTWSRLRSTPTAVWQIMVAKMLPLFLLSVAQQVMLFGLGWLVFGLEVESNPALLLPIAFAQAAALISCGLVIAALCRTAQQIAALSNLLTILLAGVSGALVPFETLPGWAQVIARVTPSYWAVRGYQSVIFGNPSVEVFGSTLVLLVMAGLLLALAVRRLGAATTKLGWA